MKDNDWALVLSAEKFVQRRHQRVVLFAASQPATHGPRFQRIQLRFQQSLVAREIHEQLDVVRNQRHAVTWVQFVYERLGRFDAGYDVRQLTAAIVNN